MLIFWLLYMMCVFLFSKRKICIEGISLNYVTKLSFYKTDIVIDVINNNFHILNNKLLCFVLLPTLSNIREHFSWDIRHKWNIIPIE